MARRKKPSTPRQSLLDSVASIIWKSERTDVREAFQDLLEYRPNLKKTFNAICDTPRKQLIFVNAMAIAVRDEHSLCQAIDFWLQSNRVDRNELRYVVIDSEGTEYARCATEEKAQYIKRGLCLLRYTWRGMPKEEPERVFYTIYDNVDCDKEKKA